MIKAWDGTSAYDGPQYSAIAHQNSIFPPNILRMVGIIPTKSVFEYDEHFAGTPVFMAFLLKQNTIRWNGELLYPMHPIHLWQTNNPTSIDRSKLSATLAISARNNKMEDCRAKLVLSEVKGTLICTEKSEATP